jgi:hypothetical protein
VEDGPGFQDGLGRTAGVLHHQEHLVGVSDCDRGQARIVAKDKESIVTGVFVRGRRCAGCRSAVASVCGGVGVRGRRCVVASLCGGVAVPGASVCGGVEPQGTAALRL